MSITDDVGCQLAAAAALYRAVLDGLDPDGTVAATDEGAAELRARLPGLYATLTPAGRAALRAHIACFEDLVAAFHRALLVDT